MSSTAVTTTALTAPSLKEQAEVTKFNAEAEAALADRDHKDALARKETALAIQEEIQQRSRERGERVLLAQDDYHHVYVFDDDVSDQSVKRCITYLSTWARQEPGCDIEIQINTPGGSIFAGLALVDYIRGLRTAGHRITAVAYGMAASMGAVILQAADVRVIGDNSFLLIHEGSLFASGDFGTVQDELAMMNKLHGKILDLFASRSRLTKEEIKANWSRRDWWLSSDEAIKDGLVDEVR